MASILKKQTKQEFIDEYQFNTILHTLDLKVEKYKKINDKVEYERWKGLYDWLKSKKTILIKEKQQWIEKACEWLKDNIHDYYTTGDGGDEFEGWFDDMFEDFKEAMEE